MKSHEFPDLTKRTREKEKTIKTKVTQAVATGIRVTFSTEPVKDETSFAWHLRKSLGKHIGTPGPKEDVHANLSK